MYIGMYAFREHEQEKRRRRGEKEIPKQIPH